MNLLKMEVDGFNSSLTGVDRALAVAVGRVKALERRAEGDVSSLVVVDEGSANSTRTAAAQQAKLAEINATNAAFKTSEDIFDSGMASLDAKVNVLKKAAQGGDQNDVATVIERLDLKIRANITALKYDTFGRMAELEKDLKTNISIKADGYLQRRVGEELIKLPRALAAEVSAMVSNI